MQGRRIDGRKPIVRWFIPLLLMLVTGAYANEPLDCLIEPHLLVDVSSSEVGVLASVRVKEADIVRKGDVIAALRTDVEQAVLEVSRARARASAEIKLLQRDYQFNVRKRNRFDELHNKQVVSAQDIDEVRTAQDVSLLRLQSAAEKQRAVQLEVERDELALARRIVHSPINGVVVQRHRSAGEFVDGDAIVQLAQLDPLRIEVVAPISLLDQVQVGMQATVQPELPIEGPFVASVISIDPIMDAATATFGARLSLPNPEYRLPPGLKCTLVLHPREEPITDVEEPATTNETTDSSHAQAAPDADQLQPTIASAKGEQETRAAVSAVQAIEATIVATDSTDSATLQTENGSNGSSCTTLGPIHDAADADQVAKKLTANDVGFARRSASDKSTGAPWTVLSRQPHPDPSKLIKRLKRAKITDFHWLKRGKWKHRLSYGRYRSNQNAQDRLSEMQALDVDAVLLPHQRTESTIWFDLARNPDDPALTALLTSVRKHHTKLTVQPIQCPPVTDR